MKAAKLLAAGLATVTSAGIASAIVIGTNAAAATQVKGETFTKGASAASTPADAKPKKNPCVAPYPPNAPHIHLDVDPDHVVIGGSVVFSGYFDVKDHKCPLGGKTVDLYLVGKDHNPDTFLDTTTTDNNGQYTFNPYTPPTTGNREYIVKFAGDVDFQADVSNKRHVDVKPH